MALTRWHTLVAALWAGITCGFLYTFGTFGDALKHKFDLGTQTSTISTCQVVVGLITFTTGLLVDWIGIGPTLALGTLINSGSWVIFAAIATGASADAASVVPIFSGLAAMATWGGACVTAAVFTVLAKNFKEHSATPIGIAKAWVGVSSGVATMAYLGFFPTSDDSNERLGYIWFLAAACFLGVASGAPMMRLLTAPASGDRLCIPFRWRYRFLTDITLVLIAATAAATLFHDKMNDTEKKALSCVILVIVVCPAFLLIPRREHREEEFEGAHLVDGARGASSPVARLRPASPWAGGPAVMLKRADAYLLWLIIFSLQSGGILLTTNMSTITQTRGGGDADAAEATAAFSCAQSLGRLFGGRISDAAVGRRLSRPTIFALLTATMCTAHSVLCLPGRGALFLGTSLAGLAFGSMYPVMIVTIGDLWGTDRIASNYMVFDGTPSAVASIAIGKWFATAVYQANIPKGSDTCTGTGCYRMTFVAVACLQVLAFISAIAISLRSRIVYATCFWRPELCDGDGPQAAASGGPEAAPERSGLKAVDVAAAGRT